MNGERLIRKAVFPVAGFGTRFLPATKAMPKELLPILNKPLIQYAAEEAVNAGIDTLIFVTGRNKRAIEDHFDSNEELETALKAKGKTEEAEMIHNILPPKVECIFVRQRQQLGLGHAILCAERVVGNEPFAVLLADDFVTGSKHGITLDLVQKYKISGKSQLSVTSIEGDDISKYGVIVPGNTKNEVAGLVEKPTKHEAPSNLASIGRYILDQKIFDVLRSLPLGKNNELQLADAINVQAKKGLVQYVELNGARFDCGSVEGYMKAIEYKYKRLNK